MAGIAVIYDPLRRVDDAGQRVARMGQALQDSTREGPVEWHAAAGLALARCRPLLVNRPPQPAWNEEGTICTVFHGEIFDYDARARALQRLGHRFADDSPASFVLHLYEQRGDDFVRELNGSFALAVWDARRQRLLIANDRYALQPLYSASHQGRHLWASAPRAIVADPSFPRRLDPVGLADFLSLGFPQGDETMFDGISELPPASLVVCQDGRVEHRRYWDFSFEEREGTGISADDYLDELVRLLRQAARRVQAGPLRVGLLLSGGLDSRVALSVLEPDGLVAFTYGSSYCSDVRFARRVAQGRGVPHVVFPVHPDYLQYYAQPGIRRAQDLINCDQFHAIGLYEEIAPRVNVLTAGSAGEDVIGEACENPQGKVWGPGFSLDRQYDAHCVTQDPTLRRILSPAYFRQVDGLARARFRAQYTRYPCRHTTHWEDYWSLRQLQRRRGNRLASLFPGEVLFRPLFYDNDLVDFAQGLPISLRWGERSLYRRVVARLAPALAHIPSTTTLGLPLNATFAQMARHEQASLRIRTWRRRLSKASTGLIPPPRVDFYVDYNRWLRHELRDWSQSILLDPRTLGRPYWDVLGLVQLYQEHMHGRNLSGTLCALISFELWQRLYLDGDGDADGTADGIEG